MAPETRLPPDLEPFEQDLAARLALLEIAAPPTALRDRVLAQALPSTEPSRLQVLLAVAALFLAAFGLFSFTRAADRVEQTDMAMTSAVAVVDDPAMPVFASLEPIGSLGPDDEVIADAAR